MRRHTLLLLVTSFCLAAPAQSPEFSPWQLSPKGRAAYEALLDARLFAVGGIGFGGQIEVGEKALRELLEEPEARAALESLARRATREGGLYALLGLRVKGFDSFAAEARRFRERVEEPRRRRKRGEPADLLETKPGKVATADGCILDSEEWEKILSRIEAGEYDLRFIKREP